MTETEVAIVGGGPVGLGLALELGLRGIEVTVLERSQSLHAIPKGQNLTQRTGEHFRAWGIADEIEAARVIPASFGSAGVTAYKTLLGPYHYDWMKRADVAEFYSAPNMRLPQYAMEAVMRRAVARLPTVTVHYGANVTAARQDAQQVTLAWDGPGKGRLTAAFAVGCDGARSTLRAAAAITQTMRPNSRRMVLAVFRSTQLHAMLERYPGKSYFNALHPDHGGYWQFLGRVDLGTTWFFHAPVAEDATAASLDLAAILHGAVGAPFAFEADYLGFWDLRIAVADSYRAGRMFIAGDAAHSHPPYGGYGVNNGLEDARNLGWKLAATLQGWGGPKLLDSYTAERHPVFVSTVDDFIVRMIREDGAFLRDFAPERDRAAFEAEWSRRAVASRDVVENYVPNYAGSPVVAGPSGTPSARGEHFHRAEPGYHLSPLGGVHARLGSGLTLITLPGADPVAGGVQSAAAARGLPLARLDMAGAQDVARWQAPAILVRPDAFVAATTALAGDDPDAVLAQATGW